MAALTANSKHIRTDVRDGFRLIFSYETVVGIQIGDAAPIFTDEKMTPTTNRHINKLVFERGGTKIAKDRFIALVASFDPQAKTEWRSGYALSLRQFHGLTD